jgi:hypothetical protein
VLVDELFFQLLQTAIMAPVMLKYKPKFCFLYYLLTTALCAYFMNARRLASSLSAFYFAIAASGAEPKFDYYVPLTPENALIGHFSPTKTPVVRIKSGDTVKIDGGGGVRWGPKDDPDTWLKEHDIKGTVASIPALAETLKVFKETPRAAGISTGHLLIGPVYVEDAEPGDSLEVRIISVVPRLPYGGTGGTPGNGGLPDLVPRPFV